jgi:ATP-dependent DNA ligase
VLAFVRPCRPIPAKKPPIGGVWLHEPKLNGYRLQVIKDGPEVRLYSRNGHDWSKHRAILTDALLNRSLRVLPNGELAGSNRVEVREAVDEGFYPCDRRNW